MRKALFLFGTLADQDVDWLAAVGRPQTFSQGQVLIHQGKPIEEIYLLLEGLLTVRIGEKAYFELARLHPGEIAGEISFLDSRPPNATVATLEASRVLTVPRFELGRKLDIDNGFAARFYHGLGIFLASRLRHTVGQMGHGAPDAGGSPDPDELDPELLDRTSLAAARFDHLLTRFRQQS